MQSVKQSVEKLSFGAPQISDALAGGAVHIDQIAALMNLAHVWFGWQRACDAGYYVSREENRSYERSM
jgi:hypothetical protein